MEPQSTAAESKGRVRPKRKHEPRPAPPENHFFTPWTDAIPAEKQYETIEQRLHDEIVAYAQYILPTPQEKRARDYIFDTVEEVLLRKFPRSEVHLFGSCMFDLCLPDGDIDVCVNTSPLNPNGGELSANESKKSLFHLSSMLKAAGITRNVNVIAHARVPIVSFETLPGYGGYNVDVGLNNIDGIKAIPLVQRHLSEKPALRPLVLVIKGFLAQRSLGSAASGGLSSYAVINLTTSFLQLNPRKRPIEWIEKPLENQSLGVLLLDFLSYYGGAGYKIKEKETTPPPVVVDDFIVKESVVHGQKATQSNIPVGLVENVVQAPPEASSSEPAVEIHTLVTDDNSKPITKLTRIPFGPFLTFPYDKGYISVTHSSILQKAGTQWIKVGKDSSKRLAIECLVRSDNDVGRSSSRIEAIKKEFRKVFETIRAGRLSREQDGPYREKMNLLSGAVKLSQDTLDRRAAVKQFVDETDAAQANKPTPVQQREERGPRRDGPSHHESRNPREYKREREHNRAPPPPPRFSREGDRPGCSERPPRERAPRSERPPRRGNDRSPYQKPYPQSDVGGNDGSGSTRRHYGEGRKTYGAFELPDGRDAKRRRT